MSDKQSAGLVVSPCVSCPTPGKCPDTQKCVTPKAGETWHILRAGATACDTVKIVEMTPRTVVVSPDRIGAESERIPFGRGLWFVERAKEQETP